MSVVWIFTRLGKRTKETLRDWSEQDGLSMSNTTGTDRTSFKWKETRLGCKIWYHSIERSPAFLLLTVQQGRSAALLYWNVLYSL